MRKGLLAVTVLALVNTSTPAQYWPTQRPYYPAPVYHPAVMPRSAPMGAYPVRPYYPAGPQAYTGPMYLPQNVFPGSTAPSTPPATVIVQDGAPLAEGEQPAFPPVPPVVGNPAEPGGHPVPGEDPGFVAHPGFAGHPEPGFCPPPHFDGLPPAPERAQPPVAPVVFHRECTEKCWAGFDYLHGWITRGPLSTELVTTGVPRSSAGPNTAPGALGSRGTIVLFDRDDLEFEMFNGGRVELGCFVGEGNRFSFDVSGFYFLPQNIEFDVSSTGTPLLARPYFSATDFEEKSYAVADPDLALRGTTAVDARTLMFGGEANGRWHCYLKRRLHTECLIGVRSVHLEESLSIEDKLTSSDPMVLVLAGRPVLPGQFLVEEDSFATTNRFYGFQLGGKLRWEMPRFYVDGFGKVALGVTDQQVDIDGRSRVTNQIGTVRSAVGAILALPSNIGDHDRQVFGVVPEVGINLGFDVCKHLRLKAGYSCMYWTGVVRPGAQIDRVINENQVPSDRDFGSLVGAQHPEFRFRDTGLFLQHFSVGVEVRY